MTARCITTLCVALLLVPGTAAVAQESGASVGDRVRVTPTGGPRIAGTLTYIDSESVHVTSDAGRSNIVVQADRLAELERSMGSQRSFGKHFGISVVSATVLVGIAAAIDWEPCTGFCIGTDSRTEALILGGVAGGVIIGIPVGILTGALIKTEKWEPFGLPGSDRMELTLVPIVGERFGFAGSVSLGR